MPVCAQQDLQQLQAFGPSVLLAAKPGCRFVHVVRNTHVGTQAVCDQQRQHHSHTEDCRQAGRSQHGLRCCIPALEATMAGGSSRSTRSACACWPCRDKGWGQAVHAAQPQQSHKESMICFERIQPLTPGDGVVHGGCCSAVQLCHRCWGEQTVCLQRPGVSGLLMRLLGVCGCEVWTEGVAYEGVCRPCGCLCLARASKSPTQR